MMRGIVERSTSTMGTETGSPAMDRFKHGWSNRMNNPEKRCVMNRGDIHVQWRGLYGNNLFQLAGGLVLAIESGAHLRSKPISGMPLTKLSLPDPPKLCHETRLDQPHFNREFLVDLLNRGQHVVVNGHHQQYR